jgi:glycosyltransferase involved in cell wall biosynthesis
MSGLASVVIPAHNEQNVIGRCLRRVLTGLPAGAQVVVVCNGCSDATADIARTFGDLVTVVELSQPSKTAALNTGDGIAQGFPRAYVDADVEVTGYDLDLVSRQLSATGALGGAPVMIADTSRGSWAVRAYYRHWATTPYRQDSPLGSGVYVLSAAGRARFDEFPAIIADDLFVYRQLTAGERLTGSSGTFVIHPPTNVRDLVSIKARARAGERELAHAARKGVLSDGVHLHPATPFRLQAQRSGHALGRIRTTLDFLVFLSIRMLARLRNIRRHPAGDEQVWHRDESSRSPTVEQFPIGM